MRVVVGVCAALIACSSQNASQDASCPATTGRAYIGDCRAGGIAAIGIDGTWHMAGSASFGMGPLGGPDTVTTMVIDKSVSIAVDGCVAGFGSGSVTPATDPANLADDTAITHSCEHDASGCTRGISWWSICVRDYDGAVRYYAESNGTTGMGTEYSSQELDYLTR